MMTCISKDYIIIYYDKDTNVDVRISKDNEVILRNDKKFKFKLLYYIY